MIRLIAAIDRQRGVAKHGFMPWNIPDDEKYFTVQTKKFGGNVLTGGKTYRETYHGPLKGRHNFILTRSLTPIDGVTVVNDLAAFIESFKGDLWVAGGSEVFEQIMSNGWADELYLTQIDADFKCDQFFPAYGDGFKLFNRHPAKEQNGFRFTYECYGKKI